MSYMIGYSGATKTEAELLSWSGWFQIDPEFRRRIKNLMDFCIANGRPIGIGNAYRSTSQQTSLFLQRHTEVAVGGCCGYRGGRYALKAGMAHAAPPGASYHEPTNPAGECYAIDAVGDTVFAGQHVAEFGLVHFGNVNGELWHWQPSELPHSRSAYKASTMYPLVPFGVATPIVPAPPKPPKPAIVVPAPTLSLTQPNMSSPEVYKLQQIMQFWGWYPTQYKCDGVFGPVTAWCVAVMQKALSVAPDGVYGPQSAAAYLKFASAMQNV